ncbi:MAG: hypothetical protein ACYC9O_16030 [Candidatus Latescibacterota bacterium]
MDGSLSFRPQNRFLSFSVFILGTLGMFVQAAFLREILAAFRGGELTMGIALLSWLLWTAAGSGLPGKQVKRTREPEEWLYTLLPLYGILGYLGTALTGNAPFLFRLTPGELAPYDLQFIAVIFFLAPFNVLGGFFFALGAKALERPGLPSAGRAFTIEACGAAFGGILFSMVLVPRFSNHTIVLACPIIAMAVSGAGLLKTGGYRRLTLLPASIPLLAGAVFLHSLAADYPYRRQELLEQRETRYSRLRIARSGEQVTL